MISNCIIQAIKGSLKSKAHLYMVVPKDKTERGVPHFIWGNNGKYSHFTFDAKAKMKHWWQFILFKGHINVFPINYLIIIM
jgi:hypothetical protein